MARRSSDPFDLHFYEGLVHSTAAMYTPRLEMEFEDVCQVLRMKIWRALQLYDAGRSRLPVERYVFMCVKNKTKDLLELKRRGEVYIEDQRPDVAPGDGRIPVARCQLTRALRRRRPVFAARSAITASAR